MGEKVKDSSRLKLCKLLFIYKALSLMIPPFSKSSSYCTLPVLSLSSSEALSGSSTTFSSSAAALSFGSLPGSSTTFSSSASAALSSGSLSGSSTTFSSSTAFEGGFFSCVGATEIVAELLRVGATGIVAELLLAKKEYCVNFLQFRLHR